MLRIINLAGRQRMLTQKMSKEILLIAWNIDVNKNKEELKKSADIFDHTLNGLINSDKELGLALMVDQLIIDRLGNVKSLWGDFRIVVDEIVASGQTSESIIKTVSNMNRMLFDECDEVVTMYEIEAAQVIGREAHVINLAGKERMLTQKMAKEFLLITLNVDADENKFRMERTGYFFERTLNGLIKGDKYLDLPPTTNKTIVQQLSKVQSLWNDFKHSICTAVNIGKWSQDSIRKIADLDLSLLAEMDKAVGMYVEEYDPILSTERSVWFAF